MAGFIGDTKYSGAEKIVVAMDIGTTHSAVSYAYLYPDDYVRARNVSKWPGQPESAGSSKIPTLVAYRRGQLKACGPEARDFLDDEAYEVAKWFKLHLHPPTMHVYDVSPLDAANPAHIGFEVPPLPEDKAVQDIYVDFMRYLMENTRSSFNNSLPNGASIWNRLRDSMVVILTTPNGWDLEQQGVLRAAAILSELVPPNSAQRLLEFVTEGEASVHYTLAYSQSKAWLTKGSVFAVVDAGGSTVDSTLYKCTETSPRVLLEEVAPSACVQAGGVFVDRAAELAFNLRVEGSQFATQECIGDMVAAFESRAKRLFDGTQASNVIDFGGTRDNDRARGIIKGKLSLSAREVSTIFDGVVNRIEESLAELLGGQNVKYVVLVGGLGESPYLQRSLRESFKPHGTTVVTAEEPAKKAAAEGAMIWFIRQTVTSRIAKSTFGVRAAIEFFSWNLEHKKRASQIFKSLDGSNRIPDAFLVTVAKGSRLSSDFTHSEKLCSFYKTMDAALEMKEKRILVWDGEEVPKWTTEANGTPLKQIRTLCILRADLACLRNSLKPRQGPKGRYYQVNYTVVVRFGGTQIQATIEWEEDGIVREGPVSIIPNALV